MKQSKTNLAIAILLGLTALWAACKKEISDQSPENQSNQSNVTRPGGVAADDLQSVSIIPMIMSSDLLRNGNGNSITASGSEISAASAAKPVKGGGGTGDVTAPIVSITSPANGASVSGTVAVSATATDNVGVASVSFSVDGTVKSTLTSAPYNFSWDASTVIDGTHTLTATAKDAKNNSSSNTITVAKKTTITIIDSVKLPSSSFLVTPPIGDQGYAELTCTPFATVYAARSIEQYYRTSASSYSNSTNIFSVMYVYNQTKVTSDCNSGTAITLTLDLMKNKGVCKWSSMPYIDGDCTTQPTAAQDAEAANFKIGSYSKMVNTDSVAIKTMIYQKHPVIITVTMDNSFINAGPGFIWSSYSGSGALPHCLIICGYDNAKHAYKVMSSWGTSWGDAGYSWIDYDFFPIKSGFYAYAMNY